MTTAQDRTAAEAASTDTPSASTGLPQFDLKLFLALNEEYSRKPVLPAPRAMDDRSRQDRARQRAALLDERLGLRGRRVLEVGCGAGDLSRVLADEYECDVTGLDIKAYPAWDEPRPSRLQLRVLDVSGDRADLHGPFDRIVSMVVWEHVRHPFAALRACRELLAPDGAFYLRANLHRSAVASHRYREVFFPYPHLLFPDSVFEEFYRQAGRGPVRPAWVNKLVYAQYLLYFRMLGLAIEKEWLSQRSLDEAFYRRFEDQLSRYPIFDLTTEYFDVVLRPQPGGSAPAPSSASDSRADRMALRMSRQPRNVRYWLTLVPDLVRLARRRH